MTLWEYRTENLPLQGGIPKQNAEGKWEAGFTTHALNTLGQQGWEVVAAFPWMAIEGMIAVNGSGPQQMPTVFVVLKRCLGSDTRPASGEDKTASVGYPRY